jgi:3-oxoacyl-[acyl-carrier-protein] synthase II
LLPQQRIAITGVGLVTALGSSVAECVRRGLEGQSGIGTNQTFEAAGTPFLSAAHVPVIDISDSLRFPKNYKFMNPAIVCALRAAREAISRSAIELDRLDPGRIALYTGSGQTSIEYETFFPALALAWKGEHEMDYKYLGGFPSHLIDRYAPSPIWV